MIRPISHLREKNIHKLLKRCQEKEESGWECIRPIQYKGSKRKEFSVDHRNDLRYRASDEYSYYEAIYQKKEM